MRELRVAGRSRVGYGTGVLLIERTGGGWRQVPIHGSPDFRACLSAEYVCGEGEDAIMDWVHTDLVEARLLTEPHHFDDQNHPTVVPQNKE